MKVIIFHNIATSYYKNIVFNDFYEIHKDFKVIHLAETEKIRDWKIDLSDIEYPYEILASGSLNDHSKIYFVKKVWETLNFEKPDVVYFGGYFHIGYWTALMWAKIHRKRILLEMDSNEFDHIRIGYKEFIKTVFVKKCEVGLTYGELSKSYFVKLGMPSNRIIIKPNVSSKTLFYKSDTLPKPEYMNHKKYFIYVGRFSEEKNLITLLNSFNKAQKELENKDWGLLLVGSGPQEEELNNFIETKNIENVTFSGFVDKHDLKNYYNHADVFVLPSIREPWGLVANEAMMCGLPVLISTQCGCSLDLVKDNGYIFDPRNMQGLSLILKRYMMNKENILEQQEKSLEIIEKFTPELAARRIEDAVSLIEEIS